MCLRHGAPGASTLERKRSGLGRLDTRRSCTLGVEAIGDTYEDLHDCAEKSCVGSQQATHGKGYAQNPLPHGAVGQHLPYDVQRRGGLQCRWRRNAPTVGGAEFGLPRC